MNFDLNKKTLTEVNQYLQNVGRKKNTRKFEILNPQGQHAICAGLKDDIEVTIKGHTGYYCAGMNQKAQITIDGNAGTGCYNRYKAAYPRVNFVIPRLDPLVATGELPNNRLRLPTLLPGQIGHMDQPLRPTVANGTVIWRGTLEIQKMINGTWTTVDTYTFGFNKGQTNESFKVIPLQQVVGNNE